jgi:hypothetical protein
MAIIISCITDGCLSARNGGAACPSSGCVACRWRSGPGDRPDPHHADLETIEAEVERLSGPERIAVFEVARAQALGHKVNPSALAASIGVDEEDVHRAQFAIRRLESMVGK